MTDFYTALGSLNAAQRQAVTTIDGPVLVVAGPGTGKTQLLSMRAANIVRRTDTAPNNILCLTFTESAAMAMRKRLIDLMGPDGNKVVVHTFHSFGADIIHSHPEYFWNGARFQPADELAGYELLHDIFSELPHSNILAKTMNDEFVALRPTQRAISHLKRAGILPKELEEILKHNQAFCDFANPLMDAIFANRLSKKDIPAMKDVLAKLESYQPGPLAVPNIRPLATLTQAEFATAISAAEDLGKTNPLTAWRNKWLEKNHRGQFVFKDCIRAKKLQALAGIYAKYRQKLSEATLFDFDDMVSTVAHTLETTPELRFNLQEQFLYVMVDEFQDTNGAQLRLLHTLADNPVHEGRPNVLAVGDDDQAIYSFQGAELSNILDFTSLYRNPVVIPLTENYRSTAPILAAARSVITKASQRLETALENISKELNTNTALLPAEPELHEFERPETQYQWIVDDIQRRAAKGTPLGDIAVLARNHKQLQAILPYLHAAHVPAQYERRSNVLESEHIRELVTLAETIVALGEQRYDLAEGLLPELLSYRFWGIKTSDLWKLSLNAYKQRRMWLELMLEGDGPLRAIGEFLIVAAHRALHEPCDTMLDMLIGTNEQQVSDDEMSEPLPPASLDGPAEEYVSPYRAYYFNGRRLQENAADYLLLLSNLRTLRNALHHWRPGQALSLRHFIDFVDLHEQTNMPIVDTSNQLADNTGIALMTAHKAKGLEFNTVYIMGCQDEIWGRKTRGHYSSLRFPYNLAIEPAGQHYDDALRLFFVAATRAKQHLLLTGYTHDANGKESLRADFLQELPAHTHAPTEILAHAEQYLPGWQTRHMALPKVKQETLLRPILETYALSATHLNNFIDVTRGGPQAFLLQNLLRFPQAMTTSQVFGHAMHAVLQRAHTHLSATGERRPLEDILHDFELQLQQCRIGEREFTYLLEKGSDVLQTYFTARYDTFHPSQKAERDFSGQRVILGNMRLTGTVDVLGIDTAAKTVIVTDYKTGKAFSSWRGISDFDKIKLHKYKQQLMFYTLLAENARDFAGYKVMRGVLDFVEADGDGMLRQLELTPSTEDLAEFTVLLQAVWTRIQQLGFPDTSHYEPNFNGILKFESDLCKNQLK